MPKSCCAFGCKEIFIKGGKITFHRFPKDKSRKELWEKALRRKDFVANDHTFICSKHFDDNCFHRTQSGKTCLKESAIPTVFDFPSHLQVKPKQPRKQRESNGTNSSKAVSPSPKRLKYVGDFEEKHMESPKKAKKVLELATAEIKKKSAEIKKLRQKEKRLMNKIGSLSDILSELTRRAYISDQAKNALKLSVPESSAKLFHQLLHGGGSTYPPELRTFALTLQFYSPKAYDYVRKCFALSLPHPSTLRRWSQSVDGEPGFTKVAINALKCKSQSTQKKILCALIIDEMAIRRHIEWEGNKFSGYVDYGTGLDDDQLPVATEAYVFMLNCVNGNWKLPIGYFLIAGLNSAERASIVKNALEILHETGVDIISLTFDGTQTNFSMARELGCNLDLTALDTSFEHSTSKKPIYIFPDPSHMIKLVRNCLASKGSLYNKDEIKWSFIVKLHEIQSKEGLHLANKLQNRHIQWQREVMKVKLATQVFSASVANALLYLTNTLKHKDFQGCEATADFLLQFNNLFDIFNSRNLLSRGWKSPLQKSNRDQIFEFLSEMETYLKGLTISKDNYLLKSNRKTGFFGFLICISSLRNMYATQIETQNLDFIMTYKLSQDHLEMLFSVIRSKGGYNNNPTAKQFKSAYVRLLMHNQLTSSNFSNCTILEDTYTLPVTSTSNPFSSKIGPVFSPCTDESTDDDNNETVISEMSSLSCYANDVVSYIAGFVIKRLMSSVKCAECISCLTSKPAFSELIEQRNYGSLVYPSKDVEKICKMGERKLRYFQHKNFLTSKNIMQHLITQTLLDVDSNLFAELNEHMFTQEALNDHKILLMKSILFEFFRIRLKHIAKLITSDLQKFKIRSRSTKLTLFKGH